MGVGTHREEGKIEGLTQPARVAEQVEKFPVPRTKEKIAWVTQPVPRVHRHKRGREDIADGVHVIPQQRVPGFTEAQYGDVLAPKVQEQIDEGFKVIPRQRRKRVFVDIVPHSFLRRCQPCAGTVFTVKNASSAW